MASSVLAGHLDGGAFLSWESWPGPDFGTMQDRIVRIKLEILGKEKRERNARESLKFLLSVLFL